MQIGLGVSKRDGKEPSREHSLESAGARGAERFLRDSLAYGIEYYGANHPNVAVRLINLADLLSNEYRYAEAEQLYDRALAILRNKFPEEYL